MVLQIIYNAKGSNRTWAWLSMISVSIFALRDVIRQMQLAYKVPYNGKSHTSPSAAADIQDIRTYLETMKLQTYHPERENNKYATAVRDLMEVGAAYADTARAYKLFRADTRKATNSGTPNGIDGLSTQLIDMAVDDEADNDLGADLDLDMGDLAMDEEEFPPGTDITDVIHMAEEFIEELSHLD
jgi:hypothetical protein